MKSRRASPAAVELSPDLWTPLCVREKLLHAIERTEDLLDNRLEAVLALTADALLDAAYNDTRGMPVLLSHASHVLSAHKLRCKTQVPPNEMHAGSLAFTRDDTAILPIVATRFAEVSGGSTSMKNFGELTEPYLYTMLQLLQTWARLRVFLVVCDDGAAQDAIEKRCKLVLSNYWMRIPEQERVAVAVMPWRDPSLLRVRVWTITPVGLSYQGEASNVVAQNTL